MSDTKKKLKVPPSLVIILAVMVLAAILTWIVPAGEYARITNEAGQTVVDPNSFTYVEKSPVNPLSVLKYVFDGMTNARGIIFSLMLSGGGLGIVLGTGMFQAAASTLGQKVKGKETVVIALIMGLFAILCVPINLNTFIPLAPLGLVAAAALGFDAIVGVSLIMLGGAVGFSCGAMNLSNTGTAQTIAELPIFSGMWYRLVCMIPFYLVAVWYVSRYAKRIKEDPTKSYVYGVDLGTNYDLDKMPKWEKKHIPVAVIVVIGIGYLIYMAIQGTMSNSTASALFLNMGVLCGLVSKMNLEDMNKSFMDGMKGMAATATLIGFAYSISLILQDGKIMDTLVHALAGLLNLFPNVLAAPAMFLMNILVNFLITSGSGQAATVMPIFVPVADLVGISRQTAVLTFNFGDGFCNNILPHAAATMGFVGAAGIPFGKWFSYMIKLFLLWIVVGCVMLMIATVIGYA
ncbi:MAG: YfcC family protein [Solobacterium sp.]|nr:YfcC family protein [Solobacterium sp.]